MRSAKLAALTLTMALAIAPQAFAQDTDPPTVTYASVDGLKLPGMVLDAAPSQIVVRFSEAIDPATVNTETFRLARSGDDGTFGDGNEVEITLVSVTSTAVNEVSVELDCLVLPNDDYRLAVSGTEAPDNGLVAHWTFDETGDVVAHDSSGNGNDGTLVNGPTWQPTGGKIGGALNFAGSGQFVDFGDVLNNLDMPLSLGAWVLKDTADVMAVFSSDDSSDKYCGFTLNISSSGNVEIRCGDGTGKGPTNRRSKLSTSLVPQGTWTCIAAVVRGATDMDICINGADAGGSYSGTGGPMVRSTDPAVLARSSPNGHWAHGLIDDVRIYNRALCEKEIRALARSTSPAPVTDTAGNALDGEYSGSLPSGDGQVGGDFVCTFTIQDLTAPMAATDLSLSPGNEQVEIAWRNPFDNDYAGVLVLRRVGEAPTGTPTNGTPYTVGNAISDGFVVYVGTGSVNIPGDRSSWTNTGLLNGTTYHYTVFAFDTSHNYADGVSGSSEAAKPAGDDDALDCAAGGSDSPFWPALLAGLVGLTITRSGLAWPKHRT